MQLTSHALLPSSGVRIKCTWISGLVCCALTGCMHGSIVDLSLQLETTQDPVGCLAPSGTTPQRWRIKNPDSYNDQGGTFLERDRQWPNGPWQNIGSQYYVVKAGGSEDLRCRYVSDQSGVVRERSFQTAKFIGTNAAGAGGRTCFNATLSPTEKAGMREVGRRIFANKYPITQSELNELFDSEQWTCKRSSITRTVEVDAARVKNNGAICDITHKNATGAPVEVKFTLPALLEAKETVSAAGNLIAFDLPGAPITLSIREANVPSGAANVASFEIVRRLIDKSTAYRATVLLDQPILGQRCLSATF